VCVVYVCVVCVCFLCVFFVCVFCEFTLIFKMNAFYNLL